MKKYLLIMLGLIILLPVKGWAGEPTAQLKKSVDAVIEILNDLELEKPANKAARRAGIRRLVEVRFNFEEMAKRALAQHWRKLAPAQQQEFIGLFTELIEYTYISKVERYEDEEVVYLDEDTRGPRATVRTEIVGRQGGNNIPVHYRLLEEHGAWRVYDVVIENVSLVSNYRTQFNSLLRTGPYEKLAASLRAKVAGLKQ